MAAIYRITRTVVRGQFANDACFVAWLAGAGSAAAPVKAFNDPLNDGGPNDHRYILWVQNAPIQTPDPKTCDVGLVTRAGANGWGSEAEALAVVEAEMKQSGVIGAMVQKSISDAISPGKILADAAAELSKDVKGALPAAGLGLGVVAGVAGVATVLYLLARR